MHSAEAFIFWASILAVVYTYVGYPVLIAMIAAILPQQKRDPNFRPSVTLIVPAHDEEKWIQQKIENTLKLDYPRELLRIVIASDGSTDRTVDIVRAFEGQGVEVAAFRERHGKQDMLNTLGPQAGSDVLVMTDTHVLLQPDALAILVSHFADPRVACVTGRRLCIEQKGVPQGPGESMYWRYEAWIKRNESRVRSCLGANGQLYAVRRSVFPHVEKVGEDFYIPMKIIADTDLRVLYEPEAVCFTPAAANLTIEFERKTRAHVSFLLTLPMLAELLVPWKSHVWWQYVSHHVMRMTVPVALLGTLAAALHLAPASPWYLAAAISQVIFYVLAAVGFVLARRHVRWKIFYVPFYFTFANLAIAKALLRWPRKKYDYAWKRTERLPISS
jgi:biofilm PGA synthesis N-glycosyltransferase PgaC